MFKNIKIGLKLTILFSLIGIIAIAVIGTIGYNAAKKGLEEEAYNKLLAVRELKKQQIETLIEKIVADISVLGQGKDVELLYEQLVQYHDDSGVEETGSYNVNTKEYRSIHDSVGNILENYIKINGYHDIHMICKAHGHIMYAAEMSEELGTNLGYGKYKNTNLAKLWKEVSRTGKAYFADFEPYEPAGGKPAAFIGEPIFNRKGEIIGVLAIEITVEQINEIMNTREGLGKTGESYLIGKDYRMRSDSYLDPANYSVNSSFSKNNKIQTEAVQEALQGNSSQKIIKDYRGQNVLSSYVPIDFLNERWALMVEIDESEAFAKVYQLRNQILLWAVILIALVILVAIFFARTITSPIKAAVGIAEQLSQGDLDVQIDVDSKDEIGQLFSSLDKMVAYIREIADIAQRVAVGDIQVRVVPRSNRDVLSYSFAQTIDYIQETANVAEKISDNDLSIQVNPKSKGDVLNNSFQKMVNNLRDMVNQLIKSSETIATAANEQSVATEETSASMEQIAASIRSVASNADSLSTNVTETSASIEEMAASIQSVAGNAAELNVSVDETSSTIEEMAASIEQVAVNSREVTKSSEAAVKEAEEVSTAAANSVKTFQEMTRTMDNIVAVIEKLNASTKQINSIVDVIDEIAEQTNLLALNAAIEAARAGEHGRGFSVVADEVRKLAERSSKSAKEIVEMITGVQKDTDKAIKTIEDGYNKVGVGVSVASGAGEAMRNVKDTVARLNRMMMEVSKVTEQQARASDQIVKAVENMRRMTQQVNGATGEQAASSKQIMKAVEMMNSMTTQVSKATEEQKRGGEQIVKAMENVSDTAAKLSKQAETLRELTNKFKIG